MPIGLKRAIYKELKKVLGKKVTIKIIGWRLATFENDIEFGQRYEKIDTFLVIIMSNKNRDINKIDPKIIDLWIILARGTFYHENTRVQYHNILCDYIDEKAVTPHKDTDGTIYVQRDLWTRGLRIRPDGIEVWGVAIYSWFDIPDVVKAPPELKQKIIKGLQKAFGEKAKVELETWKFGTGGTEIKFIAKVT